jgi:hypothetical protein
LKESIKFLSNLWLDNVKLTDHKILFGTQLKSKILLVANHAHTTQRETLEFLQKFSEWVYITVPCCMDNTLPGKYAVCKRDVHMHSPKNMVYVYASDDSVLSKLL